MNVAPENQSLLEITQLLGQEITNISTAFNEAIDSPTITTEKMLKEHVASKSTDIRSKMLEILSE